MSISGPNLIIFSNPLAKTKTLSYTKAGSVKISYNIINKVLDKSLILYLSFVQDCPADWTSLLDLSENVDGFEGFRRNQPE